MSDRTGIFGLLLVWSLLFWGGCNSSRQATQDSDTRLPNTLLWEISSDELDQTSYLFGTVHLIPAHLYFWPEHFNAAYESCEQVVMELGEMDMDPSSLMELMPRIMLPDEMSLEDLVNADEYTRIETYFGNMGLPMMFLDRIKPFFPYMLVELDMENLINADMKSYEQEITAMAREDQKNILGLETIDYQISLFDSIPYIDQATLLVQAIDEQAGITDTAQSDNELMYRTYVEQDLNALFDQVMESDSPVESYNHVFLDNRNLDWIPKIESIIREHSSFIAVGAGHLPGDKGVIQLLRAEGYTLTPIMAQTDGTD